MGGDFGVKIKNVVVTFRESSGAAKFLTRLLSLILRRIFLRFGQKQILSVELLRPFLSNNSDFLKYWLFQVLKKIIKSFDFLMRVLWPLCAH